MNTEKQTKLALPESKKEAGPVECLGLTFESETARRAHFLEKLREKLQDPAFRATPGFPRGTDEDILRMSDPPYYTACPNPFLEEFVQHFRKACREGDGYHREPFAVDVSEGKTDALYKAHSYHTKVPHLAIAPSILHYTEPGDLVLDGFCGSGMTGIAAQLCGTASATYRNEVEAEWKKQGLGAPKWGARRAILNDLAPAATFIAANYNLPFDMSAFSEAAQRLLDTAEAELGWMYQTGHSGGGSSGNINYMVWSEVFSCPECASDIVFTDAALDVDDNSVAKIFRCKTCDAELTKDRVERKIESYTDRVTGKPARRIMLKPVLINYRVGRREFEKKPDNSDLEVLARVSGQALPAGFVPVQFPIDTMYHGSRLQPKGFEWAHQLYTERALIILSTLWAATRQNDIDPRIARALLALVYHQTVNASLRNSYRPGASFGNRAITGVYYVSSMPAEANVFSLVKGTLRRLKQLERTSWRRFSPSCVAISTADAGTLVGVPDASVDYVFTDPPFGSNIFYADLNLAYEQWLGIRANPVAEAIIDKFKNKELGDYQQLMRTCFQEYARVLKPGRWMTVVFSNSSNAVWRSIQEAMGTAGFVVADVRTLDKQQGSYRQVTSSAVKQDLVISAYKPTQALAVKFQLAHAEPGSAWAFVLEHLRNVPVFVGRANEGELVVERTPQMLLDRMTAFHVQRGVGVPLSGPEFLEGISQRFPERDGMYFLPDQVAEYDRKRTTVDALRQLSLFVNDEATAIQWVRQQLQDKPQTFQDLQPQFMKELQAWAKHEVTVELRVLLAENFLHYDGRGPVPNQIHSYLSTNFKDLRNLDKQHRDLVDKARDRWYVPDPSKQGDLDQLRERTLLKEFEEYKTSKLRKLKQFRTEAVRAGFKVAWQDREYALIVQVAGRLPDDVLQEDPILLMYYDNALTRLGDQ